MVTRQKVKNERIEINLPKDIIFAMRGLEKPAKVKKKLKLALAILLFQERAISMGSDRTCRNKQSKVYGCFKGA